MPIRNAARVLSRDHVRYTSVGQPGLISVNWLQRELPDPEDQRKYAQERARIVVTEAVAGAMEHAGMRRVDVAEKLGMSKSQVTQLLSGRRNMTLRTLGDLLWSCGLELEDLQLGPLGQVASTPDQTWEWFASGTTYVASETPNVTTSPELSSAA